VSPTVNGAHVGSFSVREAFAVQRRGEIGAQDCHIQHGDQCRTDYAIHLIPPTFPVLYAKAMATHREKYGSERGVLDDVGVFGR
jgi:hypothetical protein